MPPPPLFMLVNTLLAKLVIASEDTLLLPSANFKDLLKPKLSLNLGPTKPASSKSQVALGSPLRVFSKPIAFFVSAFIEASNIDPSAPLGNKVTHHLKCSLSLSQIIGAKLSRFRLETVIT